MPGRNKRKPFADFHCDRLEYEFSFKPEAIRLDEFRRIIGEMADEEYGRDRGTVTGAVATKTNADYHAHFWFRWTRQKFQATISYYSGYAKPDPEDRAGPFTEGMMSWLGGFVRAEQSEASVSAYLSYRLKHGTALALPLPMHSQVRGRDIIVTGMTFIPTAKLNGVYEIFASIVPDREVVAIVSAERQVKFSALDVAHELETISHVASLYLEVET